MKVHYASGDSLCIICTWYIYYFSSHSTTEIEHRLICGPSVPRFNNCQPFLFMSEKDTSFFQIPDGIVHWFNKNKPERLCLSLANNLFFSLKNFLKDLEAVEETLIM